MLDLSCLGRVAEGPALLSNGLLNTSIVILWLGLAAAALAAPLVQRAYRTRVVRLMRFDQVSERPAQWWSSLPKRSGKPGETRTGAETGQDQSDLVARAAARERRIAISTFLAWLVFMLAGLPIAYWVQANGPRSDQALFALGGGLLALGPAYVNLPPRFARRALLAGLLACLLPMLSIAALLDNSLTTQALPSAVPQTAPNDALSASPNAAPSAATKTAPNALPNVAPTDAEDPGLFATLIGVAIAGFTYLALFHRTLRGVVLPVSVVLAVALLLYALPMGMLEPHVGNCFFEALQPGHLKLQGLFVAIGTTALILALWLGFKALDGLAILVESGWLSELSLMGVISVPLIASSMVAGALTDRAAPAAWLAWLPLFWSLVTFATYALALGRPEVAQAGPRLLVLRVFAKDRARIRFLDQLQSRWRYAGPVHQIGGPDLATMNVDPYESALFLVGRLHDAFLPAAASAEQLSSCLSTESDREGRYRISEAFCFNSAWRATVEQLMQLSDAIVVDLRGFSAQREGTGYELRVLARANLLDRVVAIGDESTDWTHADNLIAEAGHDAGEAPQRLQRRTLGPGGSIDEVFEQLLGVAVRVSQERAMAGALRS